MKYRDLLRMGAVMTALICACTNGAYAGNDPFSTKEGTGSSIESPAIKPGIKPSVSVITGGKTKPKTGSSVKISPKKSTVPNVVLPDDDDNKSIQRDRNFRMNTEGYLIIGNNTYRLRSITGTLMVGGLCSISVSGDISRSFNGRWTGTVEKPTLVITSSDIGSSVDGRGSATVSGLNASFVGFSGRVGNDFYRVKMPAPAGEGGSWLNGKWQDNRDGSVELSNPPDKPVSDGAVIVPASYWTGACTGSFEAYSTDFISNVDDFILDARSSSRVSLTLSNRRTGDRWSIWGTIRSRSGNTWELEPYLVNSTTVSSGRWWIEFTAFRRKVSRMEITGDTSRGGFRAVMQQTIGR